TITESPEDYDTLMRNLAPCASDILGVIFKNHANVAFEDNRKKMKDANIPAMAALKFDAPLSPNNSAPNLSFTRDGFFNKVHTDDDFPTIALQFFFPMIKETGLLVTDSAAVNIEGGKFVLPNQRCGINFSKQNRLVQMIWKAKSYDHCTLPAINPGLYTRIGMSLQVSKKTENTARDIESGEIMNRPSNQHKDMEDIIHSFQSIKISLLEHEAADVAKEVKETDIVMQEVNQVTAQYIPFTQASSSIFFILQQLNVLNHFYQFSLQYFLDILKFVLPDENNWHLLGVRDPRERLTVVFNNICLITFEQTSRALLHRDHLVLAMSLAQLQAQASGDKIDDDDVSYLSEGDSDCTGRQPPANLPFLLIKQQANKLFNNSLVLKMMLSGIAIYVSKVFNANFLVESSYNFHSVVTNKINSLIPVRLCSVPRYDASYRVDNLVAFTKSQCASITIGSQEGYRLANQAIAAAIQIWKPTQVSQLHTVVQERLRYCPLGWSKIYKFNDSDLEAAMSMIDLLMVATAKGRANTSGLWRRSEFKLGSNLLDSFVDSLFNPGAFEVGYHLVNPISDKEGLIIAEGSQLEHFVTWAQALSKREPPHWLSLPPNAEALISTTHTTRKLKATGLSRHGAPTQAQANLFQNFVTFIEDELVGEAPNQAKTSSDNTSSQPGRMRQMERTSKEFLKNPLFRFFEREIALGQKLLAVIRKDSIELIAVCNGEIKQTNPLTSLIGEITTDGFLTATRQFVSCQTRISLEVLKLQLFIDYQASVSDEIQVNGFKLQGLIIQGGCLKESRLEFNEGGDYLPNGTILQYIQTNQRRKDNQ
ncbi:hypothetical protein H4Q26_017565, partial [Puccinia striiformis f. sp. tritici PST-130]